MRERIILAPGLNGNELMKSLALHGRNCIGLRVCGAAELARLALMRSGIPIAGDFVSAREEAALTAEAVRGEPYFGKASYSDIQEIAAAIRRMRSLTADEDDVRYQAQLSAYIRAFKATTGLDADALTYHIDI